MAISFVNSAKTGSNTITLPTGIQVNDIIVLFSYRNALTAPTLASAYTNITNQSANSNSMRVQYKVASGAESGTTVVCGNANVIQCAVYRGCYLVGAAGSQTNAASTTTNLSASGVFVVTDGTSWGVYGCGSRQIASQSTPAGTTIRGAVQAGTTSIALICDTNGGVTSNAAKTSTAGSSVVGAGWSFELVATRAASELKDNFNDNSFDPQWDVGTVGLGSPSTLEQNQRLEMTPGSPGVDGESYIDSGGFTPKWNLTADQFAAELKQIFTDLVNSQALVEVIANDHYQLYFDLHGSAPLMVGTGYVVADTDTPINDTVYDPVAHRFLRITESGGTIFWQASPSGRANDWNTLASVANPFSIVSVYLKFQCFSFSGSTGAIGTTIWDNVNIPTQGIAPVGAASGEQMGAPVVTLSVASQSVLPVGAASAEAFGAPTIAPGAVALLPAAIASAEKSGNPTITPTNTVAPAAIPSSEQSGNPAITPGQVTIVPVGISSAELFGSPVTSPSNTIAPVGIGSAEAFGNLTLTQALMIAAIQTAEAFGGVVITPGQVTITPTGIPSSERLGNPALLGQNTISPAGIASGEALGLPTLASIIVITPNGIPSAEAFGAVLVTPGLATITPIGIGSAQAFGNPTLIASATITAAGIPSGEAFGAAVLTTLATISAYGIGSGERFGAVIVAPGQVTIAPAGIPSGEKLGNVNLSATVTITTIGIAGAEKFGNAAIVTTNSISPAGIPSGHAAGNPTVVPGQATILPASVSSSEAFGNSVVQPGQASILLVGIASGEAFGTIAVRLGTGVAVATIPTILSSLDQEGDLTVEELVDVLSAIPGEITIIGGDLIDSLSGQSTTDIL